MIAEVRVVGRMVVVSAKSQHFEVPPEYIPAYLRRLIWIPNLKEPEECPFCSSNPLPLVCVLR